MCTDLALDQAANDVVPRGGTFIAGRADVEQTVGFQKDGTLVFQNLSPLELFPHLSAPVACPNDLSGV